MHALTLAKQRLRDRMHRPSTPSTLRLAHGLAEEGRGRYIPVLSSATAQDLLANGYSAATLDRIYRNRPAGDVGPVGHMADRMVLALPIHEGLRERLDAVTGECLAAAVLTLAKGQSEFRAVFAPCGHAAEALGMAERLQERDASLLKRIRCWGVDSDADGRVLPEARRRAAAAGLNLSTVREHLRRHRDVTTVVRTEGQFHLASLIGASQQFAGEEFAQLIRFYAETLAPGGTLLLDRWVPVSQPQIARGLGVAPRTHSAAEIASALRRAGLVLDREHPTGEGGCVVVVARKPAA